MGFSGIRAASGHNSNHMMVHIRPETKENIRKIWRVNAAAFDTELENGALSEYKGVVKYHALFAP